MTDRYVSSAGSNTAPYGTWATAATSMATVAALVGAGDRTFVDSTFNQTGIATTTYTFAGTATNPALIISTNDLVNMPPTTLAAGASLTAAASGILSWAGNFYMYGMSIIQGSGSGAIHMNLCLTAGNTQTYDTCTLKMQSTGAGSLFKITFTTATRCRTINCSLILPNISTASIIYNPGIWEDEGSTITHTTSQPAALLASGASGSFYLQGTDLSDITSTIVGDSTTGTVDVSLSRCKLASGVTILGAQTTGLGGHADVFIYDSAFGNVQYAFAHYNYFGSTVAQVSIYENEQGTGDGAYYDLAKDPIAWTITGTNCSYATPYCSPWISVYNEGVGAVTPRFEIARDDSATAYNNDQVWAEFSTKITASVTNSTFNNSSRRALLAAAAAQPNSGKTISNWTGLSATYWLGVLQPSATITPAVIGHIMGRVCIATADTVYVNPKILGI